MRGEKNSALAKHAADRDKWRGGVRGGLPIPSLFHCVPPQIWLILLGSLFNPKPFHYLRTHVHTKECMLPLLLVIPLLGKETKVNWNKWTGEWIRVDYICEVGSDVDYKCRESERENVAAANEETCLSVAFTEDITVPVILSKKTLASEPWKIACTSKSMKRSP